MGSTRVSGGAAAALLTIVVLLLAGLAGACSGPPAASQAASATPETGSGDGAAQASPRLPVVCLLGGSAARESTFSDAEWAAEIEALSGHAVDAYNLGTRNQTFATDLGYVEVFPAEWDGAAVVFIGLNVGRFTGNR